MSEPRAIVARHVETGARTRWTIDGGVIASVEPADGPRRVGPDDDWIGPALWDIQTNGRLGASFSDPAITAEQVAEIVRAQDLLGVARCCPTLITAPSEDMRRGVRAIAEACDADPGVAHRVVGIHLEGPFLSPEDGYRGAHPRPAIRDPDWALVDQLREASGDRIALVTLAPERPGALDLIRRLVAEGIVVALGHTAASPEEIRAAADAGATLSTHLGNGIAATLPRHPNPIWAQAADDRLFASLIADGHHLGDDVLRVLTRAKTPDRLILVSDASPLAGLPPGTYGEWAVEDSGRVVVAGTPYLAGANRPLALGVDRLMTACGLPVREAIACASANPARLLGRPAPTLGPNAPADLLRFRLPGGRFAPVETLVNGESVAAAVEASSVTR